MYTWLPHMAALMADWNRLAQFLRGYCQAESELDTTQVAAIFGVTMTELRADPKKALRNFRLRMLRVALHYDRVAQ